MSFESVDKILCDVVTPPPDHTAAATPSIRDCGLDHGHIDDLRPRLVTRCMADVEPSEIRWLWPGKIPRGRLTVMAGDGGLGKSFATLSIAATLSLGETWPDGSRGECPGNTVLLNAEDDPSDTLRVRLDQASADCSRIHVVDGVQRYTDTDQRFFSLTNDIGALEDRIKQTSAKLCIIDPIGAFAGQVDSHNDASVRCVLGPLAAMASRTDCAVLAILHLNKGASRKTAHRVTGSVAWTNAARMAWLIARDPDVETRRLMLPYKHNIISEPTGLAFEIIDGVVHWFAEPVLIDPDSVLAAEREHMSDRSTAEGWLQSLLATGPTPANEIKQVAHADGIAWRTIERAKKSLGVTSKRDGFGRSGRFLWELKSVAVKDPIDRQS